MGENKGFENNFTIERQLEYYARLEKTDERYEIMWHAWKHNKRWLCQMMEWIMPSYQHYSRHDETHALSILHNIEMMLGADQVARLSASDCFLILHVVYLHDIGMCITHHDRKELMKNKNFIEYLKQNQKYGSDRMRKYADLLLTYCQDMREYSCIEDMLETKLEIYYAVLYLISEYNRKEHANIARDRLDSWIKKPDMLGIGFSTSGIPSRFYYMISACASVHTSWDFNDVLRLPWEDGGYPHDYMHPRFAAVLLQLGDALDLDNDRFHPLIKEFAGELPELSEIHLEKHQSIRRLRISPNKITIEANCRTAEGLRLISRECEGIKEILKQAAVHWSAICPSELTAHLPNFEPVKLMLKGRELDEKIVNLKFEIQQKKAFNLLQGSNIYEDNDFVFLRELFQNAIDASKIQYWLDWQGSRWYDKTICEPENIGKCVSPLSYPIEIEMHIAIKKQYTGKYILLDTQKIASEHKDDAENEYGVLVKIIDYGVGITAENISNISEVGSGYKNRDKTRGMPDWLKPTAEFGIGLQSVFLIADAFCAYTQPRTNEKYKIEFTGTGDKGDGHINVTPLGKEDNPKGYGTVFEVFVSNERGWSSKKKSGYHSGKDPFARGYDEKKELLRSRELAVQMALYINSIIGERLFPVFIRLYDFEKENDIFKNMMKGMESDNKPSIIYSGEMEEVNNDKYISQYLNQRSVTWSYNFPEQKREEFSFYQEEDYAFALDFEMAKLYIWDKKENVYARFGAERLQTLRDKLKRNDIDSKMESTKIYYKGIYAKSVNWKDDASLLEYIDIKGKLEQEYLALNRADFTEKGEIYIYKNIYTNILEVAQNALRYFDKFGNIVDKFTSQLHEISPSDVSADNQIEKIQKFILSVVGLAGFAQIRCFSDFPMVSDKYQCENWNTLLEGISIEINDAKKNFRNDINKQWAKSTLFNILVYPVKLEELAKGNWGGFSAYFNIADIMNYNNKYAIISKRETINSSWEETLIKLEVNSDEYNIKGLINDLKMQWEEKKRDILVKRLENIGNLLMQWEINSNEDRKKFYDIVQLSTQKVFIKWLLKNIPTIALYSNADATVRINILSLEYTDSIYFNTNIRWSLYERMYQIYKRENWERFMAYATTGYCQLAVEDNITGIPFVNRGQMSPIGLKRIIMPFSSSVLEEIFQETESVDLDNENNEIHNIVDIFIWFDLYVDEVVERPNGFLNHITPEKKEEFLQMLEEDKANFGNFLKDVFVDKLGVLLSGYLKKQEDRKKQEKITENNYFEVMFFSIDKKEFNIKKNDLLAYVLDALSENGIKGIEKWITENILPRYRHICSFKNVKQDFLLKQDSIEKKLLEHCGIDVEKNRSHEENNNRQQKENVKAFKQVTQYLSKNNWLHMPAEKYERLYKYYIQDMASVFLQYHLDKVKALPGKWFIFKNLLVDTENEK